MLFIQEINESDFKIVTESKEDGKKDLFIEGIFLQGDITNKNGRRYPKHVLENAVRKYQPLIDANRALGELNHPNSPSIDYERACIKTVSLTESGSNYIGKAKVLSSPLGQLIRNLVVEDGVQIAVSSRGLGSLKEENGVNVVQDDFYLSAAADVVSDPSAPNAFVNGIMEGKEWIIRDGVMVEKELDQAQKIIKKASARDLEEAYLKVFRSVVSKF